MLKLIEFFEAMKAVILAGGLGTRLSEVTHSIPAQWLKLMASDIMHIMKNSTLHTVLMTS